MDTLTTTQAAAAGGMFGALLVSVLIFYILTIIAGWKIFEKAGIAGWKSLIPIYNVYLFYKLSGIKGWFWAMFIVSIVFGVACVASGYNPYAEQEVLNNFNYSAYPFLGISALVCGIVSFIASIMLAVKLAKAFGKGLGYTIGLIFLPNIFQLILGFGSAKYDKKILKA